MQPKGVKQKMRERKLWSGVNWQEALKGGKGVKQGLGVFSYDFEASFFTVVTHTYTIHFVRILAIALQLTDIDCSGVATIWEGYTRCRTVTSEELLVTKGTFSYQLLPALSSRTAVTCRQMNTAAGFVQICGPVLCTAVSFGGYYMYQWPGVVTCYGLVGPGIESRWGRDFPHPSRPALGSNQPPIQWVQGLSGVEAAGVWR